MPVLLIDIGNSQITMAFEEDNQSARVVWRLTTDCRRSPDEYAVLLRSCLTQHNIDVTSIAQVVISSVVPKMNRRLCEALERCNLNNYHVIAHADFEELIGYDVDMPSQTGLDRLCALAAARHYNTDQGGVIVCDMGTATTFSALDQHNVFCGGAILPGLRLSLEALSAKAAQLPAIELDMPERAMGRNTGEAMRAGLVMGAVAQVEGLWSRIAFELKQRQGILTPPVFVLTGGLSGFVKDHIALPFVYAPDLVLDGIACIKNKTRKGRYAA